MHKTTHELEAHISVLNRQIDSLTSGTYAKDLRIAELERELAELRMDAERYKWLANRVLACDYGDNDAPGMQIGWRIVHNLLATSGRQPAFMYGQSIDQAVDSEIAASVAQAKKEQG